MVRLGQNFLIDSNILEVIARAAELDPEDVVLEVGGGLGVLSRHLAPRVAHLHVIEIDRGLREALEDALSAYPDVTLHWGDAMRIDLAALRPPPTKLVANLPYGIAAAVLLRTIELLPTVRLWIAMVQREVGERLAAAPGGRDYGLSSVLAQLSCEVAVIRPIARTVFRPRPNVDSVLLRMIRTGPAPSEGLRALAKASFAHRRKALATSVSMTAAASGGAATIPRARIQDALRRLGLPADIRAERLSADRMRELGELLDVDRAPGEGPP